MCFTQKTSYLRCGLATDRAADRPSARKPAEVVAIPYIDVVETGADELSVLTRSVRVRCANPRTTRRSSDTSTIAPRLRMR
jgi:hypothetical protein